MVVRMTLVPSPVHLITLTETRGGMSIYTRMCLAMQASWTRRAERPADQAALDMHPVLAPCHHLSPAIQGEAVPART